VYVIVIFEAVVRPVAPIVAGAGVKEPDPGTVNEVDIDILGGKVL